MSRSEELFRRAKGLMPGGVSSPVRAYPPYPRFVRSGKGSRIVDVDGKEYVDYCMAFGPLILGHAPPPVVRAVKRAAASGSLFGAPTESEVVLGEKIREHYPAAEMMRFTNTGTEATMHAIRLARGFTGRRKVIKVDGGYHGAHDSMLVKAGSGAIASGLPSSLGVLEDTAKHTVVVPFNDTDSVRRAIENSKGDAAAMILEPVLGNIGPVLPNANYLRELRELTREKDVLLIFDEVITGFRLGLGGAQEKFGIRPDLFTLGKIVGGGYPMGVIAGRKDIMGNLAPSGGVYQAGTFSGNPISVAAGLETLRELERRGYDLLERRSRKLTKGLKDLVSRMPIDCQVNGIGSMFQVFFTRSKLSNLADVLTSDTKRFTRLFEGLLEQGVYVPASQFETNFLSMAHTEKDVQFTLAAYEEALKGVAMA